MTSVIRIQISVCTSQDIGAPKRAINRDTLLVRENSIYVKKTRHPMIDSRNIDFYSPLVQIFYFLPFRAYSPGFKRIFLIGGVYSKVGRRSIRVCVRFMTAQQRKKRTMGSFLSSILRFFTFRAQMSRTRENEFAVSCSPAKFRYKLERNLANSHPRGIASYNRAFEII